MTKFSDFIRFPGTAGPPTVQGIYALGFALRSEIVTLLGKFLRVDAAQSFTNPEKQQGRTNLGLGTISTQDASGVAITGGSITGITDLAIADGGTGASTAPAARTALGLGNVDNTSDANKPVSTPQQAAFDLKAPLASPALTGTPTAPTAAVGTATTQVATTAFVANAVPAQATCELVFSTPNIVLRRKSGVFVPINGVNQVIPSAGVSFAPTGLTVGTLYYIYAFMSGATLTLEASTTAYTIDTTTGVAIKTGDATRTLVGMARPITGPAFTSTAKQRFVRSWFNDQGVKLFNNFTADRTTAVVGPTYAELNSEIRCEALLWAGETFEALGSGANANSNASGRAYTALGFDGVTPEPSGSLNIISAANNTVSFATQALKEALSEGYHYVTLLGCVDTGTGTWLGASNGYRASILGEVHK